MESRVVFDRVWKKFRKGQIHDSLRELIPSLAKRLIGKSPRHDDARDFWALRDLSFEVKAGEVLGIIGSNGAGKSTTLKILNRIMDPTLGSMDVVGRMGALIEVSAGFHQDLTGRQNVYLQGAIIGMKKTEVARKFDEIVEFAGISDFIDTPVKRYSSGMNARLGFSIAAHLEPDILIIDEVLAVGDHAFQQRAFGRIKEMARAGAPVVLVSHQLDRVLELCTKAILLERGGVRAEGTPSFCVNEYLHGASSGTDVERFGDVGLRFGEVRTPLGLAVITGQPYIVELSGILDGPPLKPEWTPAFRVIEVATGVGVHSLTGMHRSLTLPASGPFVLSFELQMNLPPGTYQIEGLLWDTENSVDVVTGPRVQVEVLEGLPFWGRAQLNSRIVVN